MRGEGMVVRALASAQQARSLEAGDDDVALEAAATRTATSPGPLIRGGSGATVERAQVATVGTGVMTSVLRSALVGACPVCSALVLLCAGLLYFAASLCATLLRSTLPCNTL